VKKLVLAGDSGGPIAMLCLFVELAAESQVERSWYMVQESQNILLMM
jgi:hypothetical protein